MTGTHDSRRHVLTGVNLGLIEQMPVRRQREGDGGVPEQAGHLMHETCGGEA